MDIVTGGLGFIGNELVRQLLAKGRDVAIIDNENRIAPQLEDLNLVPRYTIDINDTQSIDEVLSKLKPERVFHLAAIHYIPECNAQPERTLHINTEGTLSVLNAAIKHQCKHFIFASTGAVYHDSPLALTETSPVAPVDIYGWSKWFAEELCRWKSSSIPVTICRLFNNIGLRETNPHIVPEIIQQLSSGSRVLQLGNTTPVRDYISTQETASALIRLSELKPDGCEVYNIATGKGASVDELIDCMSTLLKENITVQIDPARFRAADKAVQLADISKLKNKLAWEPQQNFKEVLSVVLKFEGLMN